MKRLILPLIAVMALAGCSKVPDYESYKTDIIGVWCSPDGPEYVTDVDDPYHFAIEFTEDKMIFHSPSQRVPGYLEDTPYTLRDNYVILGENGDGTIMVSIENDQLTITEGKGSTTYRRATTEELADAGILPIGADQYALVSEYMDENAMTLGTVDPSVFETEADTE